MIENPRIQSIELDQLFAIDDDGGNFVANPVASTVHVNLDILKAELLSAPVMREEEWVSMLYQNLGDIQYYISKEGIDSQQLLIAGNGFPEDRQYEIVEDPSQYNPLIHGMLQAIGAVKIRDDLANGNETGVIVYAADYEGEVAYFAEEYDHLNPDEPEGQRGLARNFSVITQELAGLNIAASIHDELDQKSHTKSNGTNYTTQKPGTLKIGEPDDKLPENEKITSEVVDGEESPPQTNLEPSTDLDIEFTSQSLHTTKDWGNFMGTVFTQYIKDIERPDKDIKKEHYVLSRGSLLGARDVPLRIQSECLPSVLGVDDCDCREQIQVSMDYLSVQEKGMFMLLRQEGRGQGLGRKVAARNGKHRGLDTFRAVEELGYKADVRNYKAAAYILETFGVVSVVLLTSNPAKAEALEDAGIEVSGIIPVGVKPTDRTRIHLEAKRKANFLQGEIPDVSAARSRLFGTFDIDY